MPDRPGTEAENAGRNNKKLVKSSEFERVLVDVFGIRLAEAVSVWPRVEERHRQLFGEKPIEELDVSGF